MKRNVGVLFILLLGVLSVIPLFSPGYFPMHDDTQVARVIGMGNALREGQFPVRWVADLGYGYGYPIFNFYAPLPYYFGGLLYALGVSSLVATKIMFAIGVIAPAVILGLVMGFPAGVLSAALYLLAPYHAVQIYVRGAVGEYWSLMFWPLIAAAFIGSDTGRGQKLNLLLGVIGISGVILSHTLMGYVSVLFLAAVVLITWFTRLIRGNFVAADFFYHVKTIGLGVGAAAFFWLPAIAEMGYTSVAGQVSATAHYADHFVCISQLWSSLWGFAGSAPGCTDGMSFMLGKAHLLAGVLGLAAWIMVRPKEHRGLVIAGIGSIIVGLFFATEYSAFLWRILPGFAYLQYPWRFLSLVSFGFSIIGGIAVYHAPRGLIRAAVAAALTLFIVFMNLKWFTPQYIDSRKSTDFEAVSDMRWRVSKISDEYLPRDLVRPKDASEVVFGTIDGSDSLLVRTLSKTATREHLSVMSVAEGVVKINKAYFPGWRYFVNGKEVKPIITNGLPGIAIGVGKSEIVMVLTDTPVRILGNIISLLSVIMVGIPLYGKRIKTKR